MKKYIIGFTVLCVIILFWTGAILIYKNSREQKLSVPENTSSSQPISTVSYPILVCMPLQRTDCSNGLCQESTPSASVVIDRNRGNLARCDSAGCDNYQATFNESGIFLNVQPQKPIGWVVKMDTTTGDYIDMATIGVSSITSYGSCVEKQ